MGRRMGSLCAGLVLLGGVFAAGCGGGSSSPITGVTIASSTTTLDQGQTANVTASVSTTGGSVNTAVTWSLSSSGCSGAACGTLTNQTAGSVTYNAPASLPSTITVTVIATSVADPTKSAVVGILLEAVSVTIENKVTEIAATSAMVFDNFEAIAQNDPTSQSVTWTLTANGAPCSPGCGTISNLTPYFVSYTPPATVPTAPANKPTLTAISVTNPTKSDTDTFTIFDGATACGTGGNEGILKGNYAIMVQGWSGSGTGTPIIYAASFTADGTGKITSGQDQYNPYANFAYAGETVLASASSYSVGPDNRGCLILTDNRENTFNFHFSLGGVTGGIASKGDVIFLNQQLESPENGTGILRQQDPTAFSLSSLAGNFAFGVDGWDDTSGSLNHFVLAGSFAQSNGNLSSLDFDGNDGGKLLTTGGVQQLGSFGTIPAIAPLDGQATTMLSLGGNVEQEYVEVYVINSSEFFFVSLTTAGAPEFSGIAIAAPSSFSASSLSPNYIFHLTGSASGVTSTGIGLASLSGGLSGSITGTLDEYTSGAATTENISGNYALGANSGGRLVISGASPDTSPVCYLTTPLDNIAAFCASTDATASLGIFDTQPAATYSNSSLAGNFFFGTNEPGDNTVPDLSGVASISSGNLTGTEDSSAAGGFTLGTAFNAALSIHANGAGTLGANTVAVTNGTVLFFINEANDAPAVVQTFEQ